MLKSKVFILGAPNLYNELIAHILDKEVGIECSVVDDIRNIFVEEYSIDNGKKLLLVDTSENDFEEILSYLESRKRDDASEQIIAFLNLNRDMGIENEGLRRGVKGYFYRHDSLELFLKGIQALFSGEVWLSRDILVDLAIQGSQKNISNGQQKAGLTHREMEILALVSIGARNEKIAEELFISPHTVKTHLYNVFKKISVNNRFQAALWAAKNL